MDIPPPLKDYSPPPLVQKEQAPDKPIVSPVIQDLQTCKPGDSCYNPLGMTLPPVTNQRITIFPRYRK